jgi:GTP-binding protein YchF
MDIGILGLPKSGKTTLFNALTGRDAPVSAYGAGGAGEPNVAVVKVPDPRVDWLSERFVSKKTTHATMRYVDLAGVGADEIERSHGLPEAHLRELGLADALLAVVRAFEDDSGVRTDPAADLASLEAELLLSDLQKIENRLPRLERSLTAAKGAEHERLLVERAVLAKIKARLEAEQPIRGGFLSPEEEKAVRGFQFLSPKPLLVVFNVSESALQSGDDVAGRVAGARGGEQTAAAQLCAAAEMEIARLEENEREAFLSDYGIAEPAAQRIIGLSYELLGAISFLTAGEDESRAWTIRQGTLAPQAAGVIHSDIERGFIRAEVVSYEALAEAGSMAEARKRGTVRLEGKNYVMQDGDVVNFRFSV